ncbi:universal stress protein [Variovorax sp. H27-G14]|uniref:universal stress protein n=1 Tax=Variovorax sp. H27-G14 TaxID=3111914 RepID=UPI0038FC282D
MHYKTILAVTDLSVEGNQAVQRAALLAANCRAELHLMYVPILQNPPCLNHEIRLGELARSVSSGAGVCVKALSCWGATVEDVAVQANCADLMVLSYRPEREIVSFFRGTWHQRVMRLTRCAVLLTRSHGRQPYAKIVVAVNFTESARQLVQLALDLDDRAQIELFHAISRTDEAKLRSADVPWEVVKMFRGRQEAYARKCLYELTQSIDAGGRILTFSTKSGDAARQTFLHQKDTGATLTVVGKRRRSAALEFLSGAVSSRVLGLSSADILIVPHDRQPSSRAAAKLRIAAERGDGRGAFLPGRETVR